jgi:hypothetical protein
MIDILLEAAVLRLSLEQEAAVEKTKAPIASISSGLDLGERGDTCSILIIPCNGGAEPQRRPCRRAASRRCRFQRSVISPASSSVPRR